MGARRLPVKDSYTFKDGSHIPAGATICIPVGNMLKDPKLISTPNDFDPNRTLDLVNGETIKGILPGKKFVDSNATTPRFGLGRHIW